MKNIQNTIAYICNLAMKHASAEGLFCIRDFMKPSNWEMKIFSKEGKKRYVIWYTDSFLWRGVEDAISNDADSPKKISDFPEILSQSFKYLNCFAGDSPEEAIEKWIDYLFNGKESLSTIRMHAAIEGEDIP